MDDIKQINYYLIISGGSFNSCRRALVKVGVVGDVRVGVVVVLVVMVLLVGRVLVVV